MGNCCTSSASSTTIVIEIDHRTVLRPSDNDDAQFQQTKSGNDNNNDVLVHIHGKEDEGLVSCPMKKTMTLPKSDSSNENHHHSKVCSAKKPDSSSHEGEKEGSYPQQFMQKEYSDQEEENDDEPRSHCANYRNTTKTSATVLPDNNNKPQQQQQQYDRYHGDDLSPLLDSTRSGGVGNEKKKKEITPVSPRPLSTRIHQQLGEHSCASLSSWDRSENRETIFARRGLLLLSGSTVAEVFVVFR